MEDRDAAQLSEHMQRQARRAIASHLLAREEVEPAKLAAQLVTLNSVALTSYQVRLEIFIRTELPTIVATLRALGQIE